MGCRAENPASPILDRGGEQVETSEEHMVHSILSPCLSRAAPIVLPGPRGLPVPCPHPPASSYCRHGEEMKQSKTNHPEASLGRRRQSGFLRAKCFKKKSPNK